MSFFKRTLAASLMIAMASSSALAASEAVRPSMSVPMPGTELATPLRAGMRLGGHVAQKSSLLGAPLFLLFLGTVAITIGTIIIINNDNPSSPG